MAGPKNKSCGARNVRKPKCTNNKNKSAKTKNKSTNTSDQNQTIDESVVSVVDRTNKYDMYVSGMKEMSNSVSAGTAPPNNKSVR